MHSLRNDLTHHGGKQECAERVPLGESVPCFGWLVRRGVVDDRWPGQEDIHNIQPGWAVRTQLPQSVQAGAAL